MSDKEKLIVLISEIQTYGRDNSNISAVCKTSNEALADHLFTNGVVVREKGKWERVAATYGCKYACSRCHKIITVECYEDGTTEMPSDFCPNCGADMRKEENDAVRKS